MLGVLCVRARGRGGAEGREGAIMHCSLPYLTLPTLPLPQPIPFTNIASLSLSPPIPPSAQRPDQRQQPPPPLTGFRAVAVYVRFSSDTRRERERETSERRTGWDGGMGVTKKNARIRVRAR